MKMDPQWIVAICAGVTLLILWTSTIIGGAVWLMDKLNKLKTEILDDFNLKRRGQRGEREGDAGGVGALRHDILLNPGRGTGKHIARHRLTFASLADVCCGIPGRDRHPDGRHMYSRVVALAALTVRCWNS